MNLTDQQWTIIEPMFDEKRRPDSQSRLWRDAHIVRAHQHSARARNKGMRAKRSAVRAEE